MNFTFLEDLRIFYQIWFYDKSETHFAALDLISWWKGSNQCWNILLWTHHDHLQCKTCARKRGRSEWMVSTDKDRPKSFPCNTCSGLTPSWIELFLYDAFFSLSAMLSVVLKLETEINPLSTLHKPPKFLAEELRSKWQIEVVFQKLMLIHEALMRKRKSLFGAEIRILLIYGKGSVCISFEEWVF